MQLHSPGYFSQPRYPRVPRLTFLQVSREILSSHCSTKSWDEAHRTKFNCVHTPEPFTDQNLFINCQGLGHGSISGVRSEMMLPKWRAVDADWDKMFSVTFCLCIFIYSFILHRGTVVCWKQGIKSWTSSPCLPFCDEFLHPHCLSRVGYSLLMLLLFSVNTSTTAYTIQGCIDVSSSFSLIFFELL